MSFVSLKLSLKPIPIFVCVNALTFSQAVLPLPEIAIAVFVVVDSHPVLFVPLPFSLINVTTFSLQYA